MTEQHRWRFFRAGGFDQVRLERGADLTNLADLDQKLWAALSCPVDGLEFDARTLALLDGDADGHVRANEVIAACRWAAGLLRDPDLLAQGADPLPLAAIASDSEEGAHLVAAARAVLESLGKADADAICAADTADSARIFAATRFNGDGVILPACADDPALAEVIADIVRTSPPRLDRGGESGVGSEECAAFFADVAAFAAWEKQAADDAALLPLGAATAAAAQALAAVGAKVDDYFARCRLAAFDPRAAEAMNGSIDDLRALARLRLGGSSGDGAAEIAALPLAAVAAGRPLPLGDGANPAFATALHALHAQAIEPLLGARRELSEAEWQTLQARLAPFLAWQAAKPASPRLEALGAERCRAIAELAAEDAVNALIAADLACAPKAEALLTLDRLVHYARDLAALCKNFVAFSDFYAGGKKAVFQAGTLYLDGRSCDLVVPVLNPERHAALAGLSGIYLAYCECTRGAEKKNIAAAFTAGDSDRLMVGRNGVFYDRAGRDWDATIVKIVEHPISVRQAFWSPYKKMARLVAEQMQKFAAARAKVSDDLINRGVDGAANAAGGDKSAAAAGFDIARFAGIFAAIGLAVGAIGTALASLLTGLLDLAWWQLPLAAAGLIAVISGPAVLLAWFKLKNRNLAPLLDANGWAVNSLARINIRFGASLTRLARLPQGAERSMRDPYADRQGRRWFYLAVFIAAAAAALWLGSQVQ